MEGRITYINQAVVDMLKRPREELIEGTICRRTPVRLSA